MAEMINVGPGCVWAPKWQRVPRMTPGGADLEVERPPAPRAARPQNSTRPYIFGVRIGMKT